MSEIEELRPVSREQVMRLEKAMQNLPDQVDRDDITSHHFADGVYLRELFMPAGMVVIGAIHRTKHITIVASGTVLITTDRGVEEITGPAVFVSEIGAKKAINALTDATLMNPHPTDETDLAKIEEKFIAPSFEALESSTKVLEQENTQ
jgi:hypothetical protein